MYSKITDFSSILPICRLNSQSNIVCVVPAVMLRDRPFRQIYQITHSLTSAQLSPDGKIVPAYYRAYRYDIQKQQIHGPNIKLIYWGDIEQIIGILPGMVIEVTLRNLSRYFNQYSAQIQSPATYKILSG